MDEQQKGIHISQDELMDVKYKLKGYLKNLLQDLDAAENDIEITDATDSKFGDLTTNFAMVLAGRTKGNPRELADSIVEKISSDDDKPDYVSEISTAGPGFINFKLSESFLLSNLREILRSKDDFGKYDIGKGQKIMIEYGQPNTHKAFHIGHVKSSISGLAMVRLVSNFGFEVIKANYFGDVGMQVAKCMWGVSALGMPAGIEDGIPDEKITFLQKAYTEGSNAFKNNSDSEKEIREINKKIYSKEDPEINKLYELTRKWSREHQQEMFNLLDVTYDREYPESEIAEVGKKLVQEKIGTVFTEDQGAVIFKGEDFGLHNRVFISSEGNVTYEGKDIALAYLKFKEYDLDWSYYFTGVEQVEYFKVVFKALEQFEPQMSAKSIHIGFGHLLVKGKKESSRSGISLTGKELVMQTVDLAKEALADRDEFSEEEKEKIAFSVGLGALRYMILMHPFHVSFSFDPDQALSISGKSAPYIMYTYARAMSIIREWNEDIDDLLSEDIAFHLGEDEIAVAKMLAKYESTVVNALNNLSLHLIANYLYDLAQEFNRFYKENSVLNAETEEQKLTRLLITFSTAQILKNGLDLLGIGVLERM